MHDILRSICRALIAFAMFGAPASVLAQVSGKVYRIGYLAFTPLPSAMHDTFRQALRELNYVPGRNIHIVTISANGRRDQLPVVARQLIDAKPDVLVVSTGTAALVAKGISSTVPIVMASSSDAVGMGIVESLARPGGNVTGLTVISPELAAKRLELLAALPGVRRVAVVWCPLAPINHEELRRTSDAAKTLRLQLAPVEFRQDSTAWEGLRAGLKGARAHGIFLLDCTYLPFDEILAYALSARLPTVTPYLGIGDRGAVLAYGADFNAMSRRAARYVDQILRGARPRDLPVEQPTEFQLIVNLKTARAIGVTLPPSLVARATRIIE